jgi:phage shock protein C
MKRAPARRPAPGQAAEPRGREVRRMPLYRSRRHKMIAGVCGGIADWLGWSPTLVRILYVLVSIASVAFPGIFAYIILWIVMPQEP